MEARILRALVVDDSEAVRRLLRGQTDIDVIGEASDGGDAVRNALQQRPDVVLMDANASNERLRRYSSHQELCDEVHFNSDADNNLRIWSDLQVLSFSQAVS